MKQRFFMLVATILLMSTSVFAQNSENWDGDVNKDGVVDVADINAVIYLMKEAAGEYDGRIYYWYVGQTDPSTMNSISPIVSDNSSPGWREIGTELGSYTFSNPFYNSESNPIISNPSSNNHWYIALPSTSLLGIYDSDQVNEVNVGNITQESSITINNVSYKVYKTVGTARKFIGRWIY